MTPPRTAIRDTELRSDDDSGIRSDSTSPPGGRVFTRRDAYASAVLVVFVIVYLLPLVLRNSGLFKIGNDFQVLYANYATYFVDAVRSGFLPLWNPNEGGGFPFLSNPFTAFFYPGHLLFFGLASRSPIYNWYHHQIFVVIGICVLALGLYVWLRGRRVDSAAAMFAAGALAIGYRVADVYRFPNAIHAAAWMPWILFAYDRWLQREIGRGFLLGTFALLCLATAGYPYYTVYATFLLASYVLLRIAEGIPFRRATFAVATLSIPAILLVVPYYGSVARLLSQTVDRSGMSYEFSTFHTWTYLDLLGGLIFPPSAISEGWLYCGILPLLVVLVWVALRRPAGTPFIWAIGVIFAVQLIAAGNQSFLFPVLWSFAPGASSLRVWARMTIILLPPLALLISLAYSGVASLTRPRRIVQRCAWRIAGVIALAQCILWTTKSFSSYYEYFAYMQPSSFVVATLVSAIYLTLWASSSTRASVAWAFAALMVTASDTGAYGRQIWRASVGASIPSESLDLPGYYARFLETPRTSAYGMSVPYAPSAGLMSNWYYGRYAEFFKRYSNQPGFGEFTGSQGRKLFFSPTLDAPPPAFDGWWRGATAFESGTNAAAFRDAPYNGNMLRLRYRMSSPGYLIFVDNWDPDWRAVVNERDVPIELAFGTFKAVRLASGSGVVTFEYRPRLPHLWVSVVGLALAISTVVVAFRNRDRMAEGATVGEALDSA